MQPARNQPVCRNRLVNNINDCAPVFVEEVEKKKLAVKVLLMQFGYLQSKKKRKENKQTNKQITPKHENNTKKNPNKKPKPEKTSHSSVYDFFFIS